MSDKFKVGDMVKCVESGWHDNIKKGEKYKVSKTYHHDMDDMVTIFVNGVPKTFNEDRFEKCNKFKAGDVVLCVDPGHHFSIRKGKWYQVAKTYHNGKNDLVSILVDGETKTFIENRFEHHEPCNKRTPTVDDIGKTVHSHMTGHPYTLRAIIDGYYICVGDETRTPIVIKEAYIVDKEKYIKSKKDIMEFIESKVHSFINNLTIEFIDEKDHSWHFSLPSLKCCGGSLHDEEAAKYIWHPDMIEER